MRRSNLFSGGGSYGTRFLLGFGALAALFHWPLFAQAGMPGEALRIEKISDTRGGFGGSLEDNDQFGRSAVLIGDLDGDGIEELAVGTHGDDDGAIDAGAVWILFFDADRRVVAEQKISATSGGFGSGLSLGDQFGRAVGALGDLDGDGVVDLVVGAAQDDDGGYDKGAIWILFLQPDGSVKSKQKISALAGGFQGDLDRLDQFGRSFALISDLDGDGVDELAVGTTQDDDGGFNAGALWILFLNSDGTVHGEQKISDTQGGFTADLLFKDFFGYGISNLGDLDGDGVDDIAVGAAGDDNGDPYLGNRSRGAVYVLFLNPDGTVKNHTIINQDEGGFGGQLDVGDWFGFSVTTIGDLDGDGVVDIAVGAMEDDDGGVGPFANRGAVWILMLNPDGTVKSWAKNSDTVGAVAGQLDDSDWFGCFVTPMGDWNKDGALDIAVGSRFDDDGGNARGAIYFLYLDKDGYEPPLAADFHASPTSGPAPLEVELVDESVGNIDRWEWDFGDGSTSSETSPTHTYLADGTYTVSLSVYSESQANTLVLQDLIRVIDTEFLPYGCGVNPVASLTVLNGEPRIGTSVTFGMDNPLGTQGPSSTALLISLAPDPAYPCGSLLPRTGMTAPNAPGELLISTRSDMIFLRTGGPPWGGVPGVPAAVSIDFPLDTSLVGQGFYAQALLVDPASTFGIQRGLTNALEFSLRE